MSRSSSYSLGNSAGPSSAITCQICQSSEEVVGHTPQEEHLHASAQLEPEQQLQEVQGAMVSGDRDALV